MDSPEPLSAASTAALLERTRARHLCLIVHDELELRLRLAALIRRAVPQLDADTVTRAGFEAIALERIGAYTAVMFIVEFAPPEACTVMLQSIVRLREQLPAVPVFVFARGGNERSAARAMKLGARDYWPIHAVLIGELRDALAPLLSSVVEDRQTTGKVADHGRQPDIAGYALLKKIAQSSTARVYLARNPEFTHPVALKLQVLSGATVVSQDERMRFAKECEILSKLNHRSVANILDYGVTEDYLYLALEYFPCGSLRERLKHPVSESEAFSYAHQIGEALQILHAAKVVHRDLKPSNLMLTNDNRLVLIDFGSARAQFMSGAGAAADDRTATPYYVCPEHADGAEPDATGDLYSLGIIMFEMLAGTLPFMGKTLREILHAHRAAPIPRLPSEMGHFQAIVDKLLAKDPRSRFASAAEFLDTLDAVRTADESEAVALRAS